MVAVIMATQYMFSPHYSHGDQPAYQYRNNNNGYNYAPQNGGFMFRKRAERIDWRKMAAVDIEHISRNLDFNALQENIMNITFCNIDSELDAGSVDPNFCKLFKLAQLTIEYLLYSQEYLAGLCTTLEDKAKKYEEEQVQFKKELEDVKKELVEVKRESHKRKKLLIAQQHLMHAGASSYNKCPFCPKAFLNSSFLQGHISRRHGNSAGSGSGEPYNKAPSPDQGVGDSLAVNHHMDAELSQIKERLQATEAQLQEERRILASLRRKEDQITPLVAEHVEAATELQSEAHRRELEEIKKMFRQELHQINEKYQASERALIDLEQRYGVKRSNLGTLEDDVDVVLEKEMLQQQRAEVAALREQLQQQLNSDERDIKVKHRRKKLDAATEKVPEKERSFMVKDPVMPVNLKQDEETVVKSVLKPVTVDKTQSSLMMYPSDEEEESMVTSSLRTPRPSTAASSLAFTGTGSLHLGTSQFLEQLRQNPSLGIIRDELASVLAEKIEKCGIPRGAAGITDDMLQNKLAMQRTQRQSELKKYPNFAELRDYFDKEAQKKALWMLHEQMQTPRQTGTLPIPLSGRTTSSRALTPRSASAGRSNTVQVRDSNHTPRSSSAPSPRPHNQPSSHANKPQAQPRIGSSPKTPISTGSTTEWTSTQWDSDDDSEDEISGIKPFSPAPNVRLIQSGPRPSPSPRRHGQPKVIQSRPLNNEEDDIDDILGSDGEGGPKAKSQSLNVQSSHSHLSSSAPQPRGQIVSALARNIESQLQGRKQDKPFGGVDVMSTVKSQNKNMAVLEDFDDESDWDEVEEDVKPPQRKVSGKGGPGDTDMSTNTLGTSQWGSASKGASTVKPDAKRSTSRSSFVSVTDISSDEDMKVENI